MSGLSFGSPALVALAVVLLLVAFWVIRRERRDREAALARFGEEPLLKRSSALPSQLARQLGLGLRVGAVSLGLLALARPQLGERPSSLAHTGRDVMVLLDLSRSMNAGDAGVLPAQPNGVSRLTIARHAVSEVLGAAPESRTGLIVFGGSAFLQLPLTGNRAAFQRFLDAATTDDLGDPATDLSSALTAAAVAFEHDGERGYQTVLLVSDGESHGDVGPALIRLRRAGIPVLAVGVGSFDGAPIPADSAEAPDQWHRDHIGRIVVTRLEEGDLRRAARETGGVYARWTADAGRTLGGELARLQKRKLSSTESDERADRFQWPLGLALAALLVQPMLGPASRRRLVAAALLLLTGCGPGMSELRRGERLYQAGSYRESYMAFRRALSESGDPAVQYSVGTALYRLRRYEDAAKSFVDASSVPRLKQPSYFNLGNSLVRAAEEASEKDELLRRAIAAYEEALRLDPADSAAKWNLEIALRRRGEDRESGGSPGRGRSGDYGRGNMSSPGYEGTPEAAVGAMAGGGYGEGEGESVQELSQAEARELVEAVQREQLNTHEGRRQLAGEQRENDW